MIAMVNVVVTLGMAVLMPLGLRMLDAPGLRWIIRWWPAFAACGIVAIWLPRGWFTVALASVYFLATVALVGSAVARFWQRRSLVRTEVAAITALICPVAASSAMVAERGGYELFGFSLLWLTLTIPHLHFAGFGAALIAGLVRQATPHRRISALAALAVPLGTATVLVGHFVGSGTELAGAVILTAGLWLVGYVMLQDLARTVTTTGTRVLLVIASVVLILTMVLAVSYALGEATDWFHIGILFMVATHGLLNAFGFGLCGVVAWRRLRPARL